MLSSFPLWGGRLGWGCGGSFAVFTLPSFPRVFSGNPGLAVYEVLLLFLDCWPVVDRQLLTFLCFAKEIVSKRKATADLPFGYPFMCCKKWEMNETRYAQTTFISNPFSAAHKRLRPERNADQGQLRDCVAFWIDMFKSVPKPLRSRPTPRNVIRLEDQI